jgi:hypothetical protein
MLKPSITIGRDESNKLHVLYVGDDAEKAVQAIRELPEGIVEAEVYRKPRHFKRVQVTEPVQIAAPETNPVQDEQSNPEPAKSKTKKPAKAKPSRDK